MAVAALVLAAAEQPVAAAAVAVVQDISWPITGKINHCKCEETKIVFFRYGREEMLALFDKGMRPPSYLTTFKPLYSDQTLVPLALLPTTDEEVGVFAFFLLIINFD